MDLSSLRTQQISLAASVERGDRLDQDLPTLIGGADVGFEQEGEVTRAAMVLLSYPSLELVEYQVARVATTMPYIPGFLSFRETPALLAAWEQLSQKPNLLFVDGHGISPPAPPRRRQPLWSAGGCADYRRGEKGCAVSSRRWAMNPARWRHCWIKATSWRGLRSKTRCNPLFVSTGHRVGLDSALMWVERCLKGYRLPEPTRWADAVASRRPAFVRWQANRG